MNGSQMEMGPKSLISKYFGGFQAQEHHFTLQSLWKLPKPLAALPFLRSFNGSFNSTLR
jgi:hypothetical protein